VNLIVTQPVKKLLNCYNNASFITVLYLRFSAGEDSFLEFSMRSWEKNLRKVKTCKSKANVQYNMKENNGFAYQGLI
jgi:hypothetical protein